MQDNYTEYDQDELDPEPTEDTVDEWSNRTWEVIRTVSDGFSLGALFTHRDIVLMVESAPCLEGTVFRNKKTGKNYVLKNKKINAKKIVVTACRELYENEMSCFVIGLTNSRTSVFLLARRITESLACEKGLFNKYEFYEMLCFYIGENLCPKLKEH